MFNLRKFSNNVALVTDKGETLKYGELQNTVDDFYNHVPQKGLVFCLCENKIASFIGYVACIDKGLPLLLLNATKNSELLQKLLNIYQPEYIWLPSKRMTDVNGLIIYKYNNYVLLSMKYIKEIPQRTIYPELSLCLTTSGSTGSPKLVRLSYDNVKSNALSIAEYLHIDYNERPVTSLPMYYSFGISVLNSHLIKGATILLTNKSILQKEFWDFVKEQKATSIAGVPYTYEILLRLKFFQMKLPFLRTMIQAGGKLNAKIVAEYVAKSGAVGKKFIVMYGQTEASPRMSYLPWNDAKDRPNSIGIPIPGGQFTLMDVNDKVINEPNKDGELVYYGKNVSLGYAENRADLTKGDENHGVLHTGDIAHKDTEGFYYITGRIKRFVKLYGNRVNLDATEQLLKSVTQDVACIGIDDKLTIFVTDNSKTNLIKDMLINKTGINIKAFNIQIIEKIPVRDSGKIDYQKLREICN